MLLARAVFICLELFKHLRETFMERAEVLLFSFIGIALLYYVSLLSVYFINKH